MRPGPFIFSPILKTKVWGGDALSAIFSSKSQAPAGEAWLFADLDGDRTLVLDGPDAGADPLSLVRKYGRDLTGESLERILSDGFPILLKIIDAADKLSVQVHPDDAAAEKLEGQPRGKSEAWYVLKSEEGSCLYLGPQKHLADHDLEKLAAGTLQDFDSVLHAEQALESHLYPVPARTLHAIGAGVLLAEIQQSSDCTYRVYDWGRPGLDGKPRRLHTEKAAVCIDRSPWRPWPTEFPTMSDDGGMVELMAVSQDFLIERITVTARLQLPIEEDSFSLFIPLDKNIMMVQAESATRLPAFHACLVAASVSEIVLSPGDPGGAVILRAAIPGRRATWRGIGGRMLDSLHF